MRAEHDRHGLFTAGLPAALPQVSPQTLFSVPGIPPAHGIPSANSFLVDNMQQLALQYPRAQGLGAPRNASQPALCPSSIWFAFSQMQQQISSEPTGLATQLDSAASRGNVANFASELLVGAKRPRIAALDKDAFPLEAERAQRVRRTGSFPATPHVMDAATSSASGDSGGAAAIEPQPQPPMRHPRSNAAGSEAVCICTKASTCSQPSSINATTVTATGSEPAAAACVTAAAPMALAPSQGNAPAAAASGAGADTRQLPKPSAACKPIEPVSVQLGAALPPEVAARLKKKIRIIQPISRTWEEETLLSAPGGVATGAKKDHIAGCGDREIKALTPKQGNGMAAAPSSIGGTVSNDLAGSLQQAPVGAAASAGGALTRGAGGGSKQERQRPLLAAAARPVYERSQTDAARTLPSGPLRNFAQPAGNVEGAKQLQEEQVGFRGGEAQLRPSLAPSTVQDVALKTAPAAKANPAPALVDYGASPFCMSSAMESAPVVGAADGDASLSPRYGSVTSNGAVTVGGPAPPLTTGYSTPCGDASAFSSGLVSPRSCSGPTAGTSAGPVPTQFRPTPIQPQPQRLGGSAKAVAQVSTGTMPTAPATGGGGKDARDDSASPDAADVRCNATSVAAASGAAVTAQQHQSQQPALQHAQLHPQLSALPPTCLNKVQGELTLMYQWYVANKTAYLDQAQRQLQRLEALTAAVVEGERSAAAGDSAPAAARVRAESAEAMRAFETALQIMNACGNVEQQLIAPKKPAAAATTADVGLQKNRSGIAPEQIKAVGAVTAQAATAPPPGLGSGAVPMQAPFTAVPAHGDWAQGPGAALAVAAALVGSVGRGGLGRGKLRSLPLDREAPRSAAANGGVMAQLVQPPPPAAGHGAYSLAAMLPLPVASSNPQAVVA